jgi:hypothetical protein
MMLGCIQGGTSDAVPANEKARKDTDNALMHYRPRKPPMSKKLAPAMLLVLLRATRCGVALQAFRKRHEDFDSLRHSWESRRIHSDP